MLIWDLEDFISRRMFVKLSVYSDVHISLEGSQRSNLSQRKSLVLSQAYHFLLVSDGLCEVLQWSEKKPFCYLSGPGLCPCHPGLALRVCV